MVASYPLGAAGDAVVIAIELSPRGDSCAATFEIDGPPHIPYFWWFLGPVLAAVTRRTLAHAAESVRAVLEGRDPPPPPRRRFLAPPVAVSGEGVSVIATLSASATIATFAGALFGQNVDFIADTFGASDRDLGISLAITRVGMLVSLVAAALADRRGRRALLLASLLGLALAQAVSALAPDLATFTGAQVVARGFVNSALAVAAIAAVEEAPEGARAYTVAMLTLAGGAGFGLSVALLPIADVGEDGWRIAFALSALSVALLPGFARRLRETERYAGLVARDAVRGRVSEIFGPGYGYRFVVLLAAALLINVFNAPWTQLANRFLADQRDFSGSDITLFRTATTLLPGFFGIVLGGRLAETRGRRPVAAVSLFAATVAIMVFFTSDGVVLWIAFAAGTGIGSLAAPSIAAFGPELFPTEVRGTANALLLVAGVTGSVLGLVAAGFLSGALDDLGAALALLGVAQLIAAAVLVPRLPEPAGRNLDDISPPQV